jgi:hypothetical protein
MVISGEVAEIQFLLENVCACAAYSRYIIRRREAASGWERVLAISDYLVE